MNILQHHTAHTNDLITAQAGLLAPLQLMQSLGLADLINQHLPAPASNRGFAPSRYVQTLMLLLHAGGTCLDDVKKLRDDRALINMLDIGQFPSARALSGWLNRLGGLPQIRDTLSTINQPLLQGALGACQAVTLDIDATEIVTHKKSAQWTYKGNKGYLPMIGHIAETGQVLAYDFRTGNTPPNKANLAFIQQCEKALPQNVRVKALRIDAAGYQGKIIDYCHQQGIVYAIRARMSQSLRRAIAERDDTDWEPLLDDQGQPTLQSTYTTSHCINHCEQSFKLVIQRKPLSRQAELALDEAQDTTAKEDYTCNGYIYRAIATNHEGCAKTVIDWYNQRADDSENRIKELKLDFAADQLPCSDFKANALYFGISVLAYNLFALMRQITPELGMSRVKRVRYQLYQMAGKVVRTGRRLVIRLCTTSLSCYIKLMLAYREFRPPSSTG